jgi:hypothetical protein
LSSLRPGFFITLLGEAIPDVRTSTNLARLFVKMQLSGANPSRWCRWDAKGGELLMKAALSEHRASANRKA